MKTMKKVFAMFLAVVMIMHLGISALAEGTAVAKVGDKTYTSISAAIAAVTTENSTVKLLANVSDVTIPSGTTVTIDLNGYTISSVGDHAITNNGTLTVTGTGTVDGGSTSGKGALYNAPGAIATLNGGTYTTDSWYVIKNLGTLTMNGATVTSNDQDSSAIANGYYGNATNDCGQTASGTETVSLTINSGAVAAKGLYTIKNDDYGVITINGGTFTNSRDNSGVVLNAGKSLTISAGSFTYTGSNGAVIQEYRCSSDKNAATLTISGGDFTATDEASDVLGSRFNTTSGGTVSISGGTFVGNLEETTTNETVTITGGTFSAEIPENTSYVTNGYTAPETATIIVHGVAEQTYTAYKIFDVTQSGDAYAYSIDPSSPWLEVVGAYIGTDDGTENAGNFMESVQKQGTATGNGLTLTLSADGSKYVVAASEDFDAKAFSEYLLNNIPKKENGTDNIEGDGKDTANSDGTATISGLTPGYYLVDSSLGALMILDTADVATVNEKNAEPTLTKEVEEDSTGKWGSTATADMQQVVDFKLTVNVGSIGTGIDKDYSITDTLPNGMTYVNDSLKVTVDDTAWTVNSNDAENDYSVTYTAESTTNDKTTPATLVITLNQSKLATLATNTNIEITYKATVDADAVIGYPEGNTNTASLTYGTYKTVDVQATVYTYKIGEDAEGKATIVKVDGSTLGEHGEVVETTTKLAGVKFVLSKTENNTIKYAVLTPVYGDTEDTSKVTGYKLTGWTTALDDVTDENGAVTTKGATRIVTDENGNFVVYGLDADTYILTETETLPGYNMLTDTITVVVAEDGKVTYKYTSSKDEAAASIIVTNNTGTELPSTGGIGTTIFYVVGSVLVISAAVLLIVRKRMNKTQD